MNATKIDKKLEREFLKIARKHFFIETLEERKRDSLDFHNVSVWGIQAALKDAYELGQAAGRKEATK